MLRTDGHFCCCQRTLKDHPTYALIKSNLELLKAQGEKLSFRPGQMLFYEGHNPCGFFVVTRGSVVLEKEGVPCGSPSASGQAWDGIIGLCQLMAGAPYMVSCKARDEVELLFYSKAWLLHYPLQQTKSVQPDSHERAC